MTRKDTTANAGSPADDPEDEVYTARHDWTASDVPTPAIVRGVAAVTGTDPMEMRPLYDVLDPEAVNQFVTHASGRGRPTRLSFRFEDCAVAVHADGRVVVTPCE
ncbi:HalOD1 output domain-containing protein [Natrinema salsiterrestre]|uniref:Halobacterial output domain-containing protein n=1 Tax=Natrinema salsiterrestre TaxID=2950540 RepID=A0A9Q4PZ33_9EURY|nr:HalOD1 output domain-containing protein [Natrinema salsiterrestre]MDF9744015.1 hypothetical protein [Natrinema salsiterrestre]